MRRPTTCPAEEVREVDDVVEVVQEVFGLDHLPSVTSKTDSRSLWDHLNTTKVTSDARLRVDVACIREMVKMGEIKVDWVDNSRQLADCLTKAGAVGNNAFSRQLYNPDVR